MRGCFCCGAKVESDCDCDNLGRPDCRVCKRCRLHCECPHCTVCGKRAWEPGDVLPKPLVCGPACLEEYHA